MRNLLSITSACSLLLFLFGCVTQSNNNVVSPAQQAALIPKAVNIFTATVYSTSNVKFVSQGPATAITSTTAPGIIATMTTFNQGYVATGDSSHPSLFTAVPLSSSPGFSASDQPAYIAYIKSIVLPTANATTLNWTVAGVPFSRFKFRT